jgi:hypothetical protein
MSNKKTKIKVKIVQASSPIPADLSLPKEIAAKEAYNEWIEKNIAPEAMEKMTITFPEGFDIKDLQSGDVLKWSKDQ